ncbi:MULTISPECIES: hypothetical protein [Frankia]|uniref:hypothetical protein n=1 Tax=Frankia TaxID=1854 RepID=UPI001E35DD9F|nr:MULTISPECIES: hypothetical protein [Frankia]
MGVVTFVAPASAAPVISEAAATPAKAASVAPSDGKIVQYYNGQVLSWNKDTWNGAKVCVVTTPTEVHCFDSRKEADAYTSTADGGATTQGYDCSPGKYSYIVDAPNYSGYALAFRDWGYWQNLSQWVSVPWTVRSWDNISMSCKGYLRWGSGGSCHYIAPYTGQPNINIPSSQIFLQNPSNPPAPGC